MGRHDPAEEKRRCPICGWGRLADTGRVRPPTPAGGPLQRFCDRRVLQCRRCGLYFADPPVELQPTDFKAMYTQEYFVWKSRFWRERKAREIAQRLRRLLDWHPTARSFLDIGCGTGAAIAAACQAGLEASGIDVRDNRRADLPGHEFHRGEALEVIRARNWRGAFDLIYVNSVLEHVPDPHAYVEVLKRALRPGGCLYIGVPNEGSLRTRFERLLRRAVIPVGQSAAIAPLRPPYHLSGFTRNSLERLVRAHGLEVLGSETRAGVLDFLRNRPLSKGFWVRAASAPVALLAAACSNGYYLELYARRGWWRRGRSPQREQPPG